MQNAKLPVARLHWAGGGSAEAPRRKMHEGLRLYRRGELGGHGLFLAARMAVTNAAARGEPNPVVMSQPGRVGQPGTGPGDTLPSGLYCHSRLSASTPLAAVP